MSDNDEQNSTNGAKYNIRVLDRAFTVLDLLSDGKPRTALDVSKGIDLKTKALGKYPRALVGLFL